MKNGHTFLAVFFTTLFLPMVRAFHFPSAIYLVLSPSITHSDKQTPPSPPSFRGPWNDVHMLDALITVCLLSEPHAQTDRRKDGVAFLYSFCV